MREAMLLASALMLPGLANNYQASVGGPTAPDGKTELAADLPGSLHKHNISSRGEGCCVFRSLAMAADFQGVAALHDFPEWLKQKGLPGGGYPGNVTDRINKICKERGLPVPDYIQIESKDLELLKAASKTGRMLCFTYARSPTGRYAGQQIAHMVNGPYFGDQWVCVLDNNYPGADKYEWMTPAEFVRYCNPRGYWAVVLLAPPPPPVPRN